MFPMETEFIVSYTKGDESRAM